MTFDEFVTVYKENGRIAAHLCFHDLDPIGLPVHVVMGQIPEMGYLWNPTGWDWVYCLTYYPEHAKYCDWDTFSTNDWVELLSHQPKLASLCDFSKLNQKDLIYLVKRQPKLKKFFDTCDEPILSL